MNIITSIARRLATVYDAHEARAVARALLEDKFRLSQTDVLLGKDSKLSAKQREELEKCVQRLLQGEPVQYVTGCAWFLGRPFHVDSGCLIPRPETEDLVKAVMEAVASCSANGDFPAPLGVLDVGTGSGCIALSLALSLGGAVDVEAWDISRQALAIAEDNARRLGAAVSFRLQDALRPALPPSRTYHIIVSNPPYVRCMEKARMQTNVLDHEPHQALFVPDDDPQMFYRAIARMARKHLVPKGRLLFECNRDTLPQTAKLLDEMGFFDIQTITDRYGVRRHLSATQP